MSASRHIRVLVIEDDEFITMVYKDQLSDVVNIEFEVDAYTLMEDGMDALESGKYDVLLLDLNLPDSDYENTINRLSTFSHQLPVIIMTSTNDELLALKTMNMGGQDYLLKSNLDKTLFIRSILYGIERHQLRRQLESEKEKSDKLLRNILPEAIANELKSQGKTEARHYEHVSVMFVDFAGFTAITASMKPNELVEELHTCFSYFDEITEKYGLEKIKTIGDAYMCAGGIPNSNETHTRDMTNAAFEIMDFVKKRHKAKLAEGKVYWNARIGIHVGEAIAGVVGSRKFTYDIWGDTVNTAARMESNSEPGKINISHAAKEALPVSSIFNYQSRGKISVKGKGELEMYFVDLLK
jgi:class 3 adenylate cyclase